MALRCHHHQADRSAGVAVESSALARALSQVALRVSLLVRLEAANVSSAQISEVTPNERAGLKSAICYGPQSEGFVGPCVPSALAGYWIGSGVGCSLLRICLCLRK